jgi:hypothetical protein
MFTPVLEAEQPATVIVPSYEGHATVLAVPFSEGRVSDGAHTFDELYEHRCLLFLAWVKTFVRYLKGTNPRQPNPCWMSRVHDDGSVWEGWFVAGVESERGAVTYHLRDCMWPWAMQCGFQVLEKAPPYDGHDSFDVLARLADFVAPRFGDDTIRADDGTRAAFAPLAVVEERSAPPTMVDEWQQVLDREGRQMTKDLTFGQALEALKRGERVARAGWNGKGMFLFLLPANDGIPTKVITDPGLRKVIETELGGDTFDAYGSIRMFTADKKILTGWSASQTDMLCEDWCILPTA